jgi:hypothetical protein
MLMQIFFGRPLSLLISSKIGLCGDRGEDGKMWWQNVAENAGNQELLKSLGQRSAMGDSSAKAELEVLEI